MLTPHDELTRAVETLLDGLAPSQERAVELLAQLYTDTGGRPEDVAAMRRAHVLNRPPSTHDTPSQ